MAENTRDTSGTGTAYRSNVRHLPVAPRRRRRGRQAREDHVRPTPKSSTTSRPRKVARIPTSLSLDKAPSGIAGLDEITGGGLPRGRPTLVCGSAGCGKTLFAMEFLVRGAVEHGEPGVFMSFEETEEELATNVVSLGFDLRQLVERKQLAIDYVRVERNEIEETGAFDLEGLFVRLRLAIESVGAKRVALDTIESLFSSLPNPAILRSELRRLFRWLKDQGMTTVITGEQGVGTFTRQGLEEYISDCVIFLDHRVNDQISTRRLRVVKYRGTTHGSNEYPFLIDETGISVLPITSLRLDHEASSERVSTGIERLDEMLGGGYFKGTTILCSGSAGTGKTSVAAHLARAACEKGERCLFFAFEESSAQLLRNMGSIGIDLGRYTGSGSCDLVASRPYAQGLEMHLLSIHKAVNQCKPALVVIDPISNLVGSGSQPAATPCSPGSSTSSRPGASPPCSPVSPRVAPTRSRPRWASPRSSTPGWCWMWCAAAGSATAPWTSSSRAAWPTPTRRPSTGSRTRGCSCSTPTSGRAAC